MRKDMAKVIVERPRRGGNYDPAARTRYKFNADNENYENPPNNRVRRNRSDYKELNENLQPLRRWLDKQVGRPWDKVYSELCEYVSKDSACQLHILQHVGWWVCTHQTAELTSYGPQTREYHVDKHGLLQRGKPYRRYRPTKPDPGHMISENVYAEQHHGCWYAVTYAWQTVNLATYAGKVKSRRNKRLVQQYDNWSGRVFNVMVEDCLVPVSKQAMNSKEIKRRNLAA